MAVTRAREQSYIRALMYLGPKPRQPKPIAHPDNYPREEAEAYIRSMEYDDQVQMYFIRHVFQGPTSALGNTDTWIQDFYHWQADHAAELHACK